MDRISNYRQITLLVHVGQRGHWGSVTARSVRAGRATDRLVERALYVGDMPVDDPGAIVDVLEQAVAALRGRYPIDASPEGPESPEGTTGGPLPQWRGYGETPPLPGT